MSSVENSDLLRVLSSREGRALANSYPLASTLEQLRDNGQPVLLAAQGEALRISLLKPDDNAVESAHDTSEVYFVAQGGAIFEVGSRRVAAGVGDLLYVPAGEAHRFLQAKDLVLWKVLFGLQIAGIWISDALTMALALARPDPASVWTLEQSTRGRGIGLVAGQTMVRSIAAEDVASGVVIYRFSSADTLEALWAHSEAAPTVPGYGTATRDAGAAGQFIGRFTIQYRRADDARFGPGWSLTISPSPVGDHLQLSWRNSDAPALEGVGRIVDGQLLAVWGQPNRGIEFSLLTLPTAEAPDIEEQTLTLRRTWSRPPPTTLRTSEEP